MSMNSIATVNELKIFISGKFDNLNQDVNYIKEQTTKTNGRVTKLEELYAVLQHYQDTCPVQHLQKEFIKSESEQKRIDQEMEIIRVLTKNPKILKYIVLGLVLTTLASITAMVLTFFQFSKIAF